MTEEKKIITERRRHKRNQLETGIYALCRQGDYSELARIIDVNMDGIAFIPINKERFFTDPFEIDIILGEDTLSYNTISSGSFLEKIPVKPVQCDMMESSDSAITIRCGGEFGELSTHLISQLDCFTRNHSQEKE
ncbi:MAG: hypothetical protein KAJ60_09725 [Desulfobulbaceae bacterium]|nr:hypothetical protein [Desulfobulbaceae bacterium]